MALRYNAQVVSTNLNGITSGSTAAGATVVLGDNARQKVRNLSAYITITLNTASLTATAKWQVSNDGSTWVDFAHGTQNAAGVTLGTGSISALTKAIPAPDGVYGWRNARIVFVTGGATGGAADVYTLGYNYRTGL